MPRRELQSGQQIVEWITELAQKLQQGGKMILIGSAGLLWHSYRRGLAAELPEASMDVDPVTDSDEIARHCYDCLIGSEFEKQHGWHVNLMPDIVLNELPAGWPERAATESYGRLTLIVPQPEDLLIPKLRRNEPRDWRHYQWAKSIGLVTREMGVEPRAKA